MRGGCGVCAVHLVPSTATALRLLHTGLPGWGCVHVPLHHAARVGRGAKARAMLGYLGLYHGSARVALFRGATEHGHQPMHCAGGHFVRLLDDDARPGLRLQLVDAGTTLTDEVVDRRVVGHLEDERALPGQTSGARARSTAPWTGGRRGRRTVRGLRRAAETLQRVAGATLYPIKRPASSLPGEL